VIGVERIDGGPRSVIVVGAGIVGLSTAWFLQERGVEVTVVDRAGVAAGASWGNAGWVAPALALPLNSPGVVRYGLRSLRDPASPLHIPLTADSSLGIFLLQFAANCRRSSWSRAVKASSLRPCASSIRCAGPATRTHKNQARHGHSSRQGRSYPYDPPLTTTSPSDLTPSQ